MTSNYKFRSRLPSNYYCQYRPVGDIKKIGHLLNGHFTESLILPRVLYIAIDVNMRIKCASFGFVELLRYW